MGEIHKYDSVFSEFWDCLGSAFSKVVSGQYWIHFTNSLSSHVLHVGDRHKCHMF